VFTQLILLGDQLTGVSTADAYRRQLLQQCRHLEVDCWDQKEDTETIGPSLRMGIHSAPSSHSKQCISIERITGSGVVINAHAAMPLVTSRNVSMVQKVWPSSGRRIHAGQSRAAGGAAAAAGMRQQCAQVEPHRSPCVTMGSWFRRGPMVTQYYY